MNWNQAFIFIIPALAIGNTVLDAKIGDTVGIGQLVPDFFNRNRMVDVVPESARVLRSHLYDRHLFDSTNGGAQMTNVTLTGLLPLILMILLAYFILKRTNRTKRKKSRGKRNVFIYSVILAMSIVVYYVFITQADIEAADVKLHDDYESTFGSATCVSTSFI